MSRTLFAMELSIRVDGHRLGLIDHLRGFTRAHQTGASRADKATYWASVSALLLRELPHCARGIWDYSDDAVEAQTMFRDYAAVLTTKKGARSTPSMHPGQGPMRGHGGELFCNVTFAWLVVRGSGSGIGLAQACAVDPTMLWNRATFTHLVKLMDRIQPGHIQSDVFYVVPGEVNFALTRADLDGPDFAYLRPIEA